MTTWDTICRVCASPSQYDIFSKIPIYLHESSNEFINWQKPINVLLEETTGLTVSRDDGLPVSICALCISYLKHASTFRDQFIKNTLSLKIIKQLRDEKKDKNDFDLRKDSMLITEQELNVSEQRKIDSNVLSNTVQHSLQHKVSKELFQTNLTAPTQEYIVQQMRYLNLLFDKDINKGVFEFERQGSNERENSTSNQQQYVDTEDYETETTSNDDVDGENFLASGRSKKDILSYSEKNFEEDDIMNMEELRDAVSITIPETCKERKCRACFRRFMLEDTHEVHMEKCFEYKFLTFIEEINLLLDMRRKKALSPHEFIRRMIFSIRKICDFLKTNSEEVPLPMEVANNANNRMAENNAQQNEELNPQQTKDSNESVLLDVRIEESQLKVIERSPLLNFLNSESVNNDFLSMCDRDEKQIQFTDELFPNRPPSSRITASPITIHNNILYEIERSQSRCTNKNITPNPMNNDDSSNCVRLMRPIPVLAATPLQQSPRTPSSPPNKTPTQYSEQDRMTFLQKLERAVYQSPQQSPRQFSPLTTPSISVRKDLMPNANGVPASPSSFSACCNTCNVAFDTISAFEVHNAMYHNSDNLGVEDKADNRINTAYEEQASVNTEDDRLRIIAMFENEDEFD